MRGRGPRGPRRGRGEWGRITRRCVFDLLPMVNTVTQLDSIGDGDMGLFLRMIRPMITSEPTACEE